MNKRNKNVSLVLLVIFSMSFITALFAEDALDFDVARIKAYEDASEILDRIEQECPSAGIDVVKLRERLRLLSDSPVDVDAVQYSQNRFAHIRSDWAEFYDSLNGTENEQLISTLKRRIANQKAIGYSTTRRNVMLIVDNIDNTIECAYTDRKVSALKMPNSNNMNIEHVWPQSKGAKGIAKSDMHHLFPTDSRSNSIRGNYPFGMTAQPTWEENGSKCDRNVFEVRPESRGNTARAMFYFSVRYSMKISDSEERVLREWHIEDPVDDIERVRTGRIEEIQGNRNPFVDRPDLVDSIDNF